jgi:SNF2 family DNA or RNA helicase
MPGNRNPKSFPSNLLVKLTVVYAILFCTFISVKLCNHPGLLADEDQTHGTKQVGRRAGSKQVKYTEDEPTATVAGADGIGKFLPYMAGGSGGRGNTAPVHPEWSGKMFVLYRLMKEMRRPGNGNDKIVIISNYTQTLDLIGRLCKENSWGFCRLDGSVTMKKRQKMVDEFNDPSTSLVAFLLSSKAGGWYVDVKGIRGVHVHERNVCTRRTQPLPISLVLSPQWFESHWRESASTFRSR